MSKVRSATRTPGVRKIESQTKRGLTVRYEVMHRLNGTLTHEGTYETYDEACRVLRRVKASVDDDLYVPRRSGEVTFGEVGQQWLAKKVGRRSRTYNGYEAILTGRRLAPFADLPVKRMTYDRIGTFVAGLQAEGLAPSTVKHHLSVIRGVLGEAVKLRLLRTNPCHDVEKPTVGVPETYELQMSEVESLIQHAGYIHERWGLLVATAAYSGLRAGELAALRVQRVNLAAGTIDVRESLTKGLDGKPALTQPKSRAGRRTVRELPPSLTSTLARYVTTEALDPSDYLFGHKDADGVSHAFDHSNFYRRVFQPAARAAGLPMDKRVHPVTVRFHDLRHFHAAMLLGDEATSLKDAQAQMGHASLAMTTDRYAHVLATSGKGRGSRVDAARAAAQVEASAASNVVPLRQRASG